MSQGPGEDRAAAFEQQRSRLMGVCYRMLGSVADAEDVVQEAWLRWSRVDLEDVDVPEALLTTIATRLALDRLRRVKLRREVYSGSWLPEPVVAQDDPAAAAELADSLSMALLVVLETLTPLERAAFVLHEVFARPYADVAAILQRSEPAVRQLVHRARDHVDAGHARYQADRGTHAKVVRSFLAACETADVEGLMGLLAPDVVMVSDGGGVVRAPRRPVNGADKVARLLAGIAVRVEPGTTFSVEIFNGTLGLVARVGGEPVSAMAVTIREGVVQTLHLIANPAKLAPLRTGCAVAIH